MGVDCYMVADSGAWMMLGRAYHTEDAPSARTLAILDQLNGTRGNPGPLGPGGIAHEPQGSLVFEQIF